MLGAALQAFCPIREIPKGKVHENVLEAFSIKDKVRGILICDVLCFVFYYIMFCVLSKLVYCYTKLFVHFK